MSVPRDIGDSAAFRQRQAIEFDKSVQESGLGEMLSTEASRTDYLRFIKFEGFLQLLVDTNYILLDRAPEEEPFTEEQNVAYDDTGNTILDVMPAKEDKIPLLAEVYEATQRLEDPQQQAMVLGFGSNAVHAFKDGNGRCARVLYGLFGRDYRPGDKRFIQALGPDGDRYSLLNPGIFTHAIYEILQSRVDTHHLDADRRPVGPKVVPAVSDKRFLPRLEAKPPISDKVSPLDLATVFAHPALGSVVAAFLVQSVDVPGADLPTVPRVSPTHEGQQYFIFDDFLLNANASELETAYGIFQAAKQTYITVLLNALTGGYDMYRMAHPADRTAEPQTLQAMGLYYAENGYQHDID